MKRCVVLRIGDSVDAALVHDANSRFRTWFGRPRAPVLLPGAGYWPSELRHAEKPKIIYCTGASDSDSALPAVALNETLEACMPLAEEGARTCVWRSCSLKGKRTTDDRCPECGIKTESTASFLDVVNFVAPEPTAASRPLIVTMNEIPGYDITEVRGDVFGLVVMSRDYFSNMRASLKTLVGGEIRGYSELLTRSRNQARIRLWEEARALGGNAVVAMRFDCNSIGDLMTEVAAYGTAVRASRRLPTPPSDDAPTQVAV